MLELAGINIESLPFEPLKKVHDLLYGSEPILSHYQTAEDRDCLVYWVDFSDEANRWLIWIVKKHEIYSYLSGELSLLNIISNMDSDYVFLLDKNEGGEVVKTQMLNFCNIPNDYLPDENSVYDLGLPIFYRNYLSDTLYLHSLRYNGLIFQLDPTDKKHDNAVSVRAGGLFMIDIDKSMDGYIDYKATSSFKERVGDRTKLNKQVNQVRKKAERLITDAAFKCFEVVISIDTISLMDIADTELQKWRNSIIEDYKNDVLDVDFSDSEDANAIIKKFPDEEARKKIFAPIVRILNNKEFTLSVSNKDNSFTKNYADQEVNEDFTLIVLPPPTMDELLAATEQQSNLMKAVFNLPVGKKFTDFKKKQLVEGLIYTQVGGEQTFPLDSPIEIDGTSIAIKYPLECTLTAAPTGNITLQNRELNLYAEGANMPALIEEIKRQFAKAVDEFKTTPENANTAGTEIAKILSSNLF